MSNYDYEQLKSQVGILAKIKSRIQGVQQLCYDSLMEYTKYSVINMQFYKNGTLMELIANQGGKIEEQVVIKQILQPLTQSLAMMHSMGVTHRDICPQNVMFDEHWRCRLIDFKSAQDNTKFTASSLCNQPTAQANVFDLKNQPPELLQQHIELNETTNIFQTILNKGMDEAELQANEQKFDIWELGCLIFEALTGAAPFPGEEAQEVYDSQVAVTRELSRRVPQQWEQYKLSPIVIGLLRNIFKIDPRERPSAMQLLDHKLLRSQESKGVVKEVQVNKKKQKGKKNQNDQNLWMKIRKVMVQTSIRIQAAKVRSRRFRV